MTRRRLDGESLYQIGMVIAFFVAVAWGVLWLLHLIVTRGGTIP